MRCSMPDEPQLSSRPSILHEEIAPEILCSRWCRRTSSFGNIAERDPGEYDENMSFCLSTDPRKPACMLQSDVSLRTSVVHGGNEPERCCVQLFPTYECQQCGYLESFSYGIAVLVCVISPPLSLSLPTMELTHIVTCTLRLGCRPSKMFTITDSALHRHVLRGNEFTSRRYMRKLSLWMLGDTLKMDFLVRLYLFSVACIEPEAD